MYIVGVYFCQVVSDHLMANPEDTEGVPLLQDYFGSIDRAVVTLYQTITNGISWRLMVRPLQQSVSPLLILPVCAYVAFALLALLNIITGVFVENAMKSAKKDDDMYMLAHSRQLFLDLCNESGVITWEAFKTELHNPDLMNYFRAVDLSIDEAHFLFTLIDIDESGSLTPEEFVNGCLRLKGSARALDLAVLMREVVHTQRQLTAVSTALIWMTQTMDPQGASDCATSILMDLEDNGLLGSDPVKRTSPDCDEEKTTNELKRQDRANRVSSKSNESVLSSVASSDDSSNSGSDQEQHTVDRAVSSQSSGKLSGGKGGSVPQPVGGNDGRLNHIRKSIVMGLAETMLGSGQMRRNCNDDDAAVSRNGARSATLQAFAREMSVAATDYNDKSAAATSSYGSERPALKAARTVPNLDQVANRSPGHSDDGGADHLT